MARLGYADDAGARLWHWSRRLDQPQPERSAATLTWYIIDRLRGREPIDWRERFRKQREELIARMQADKDAREKARHMNTRPAHDLTAYAGDYEHPAYGVMSIKEQGGDTALVVARHVRARCTGTTRRSNCRKCQTVCCPTGLPSLS